MNAEETPNVNQARNKKALIIQGFLNRLCRIYHSHLGLFDFIHPV